MGPDVGNSSENFKLKLYNAMDSDNKPDSDKCSDTGKAIDKTVDHIMDGSTNVGQATDPPFAIWSKVFPGLDPASVFFPKTINPGPGFNVPGGQVPIFHEICKHIDYNSHILNQFKNMDLKTAIEQRDNNYKLIEVMVQKTTYAQGVLSQVPTIPTTEYEFKLKNQILKDLDELNRTKVRAEARATLLNSRIEFIQIHRKPDE
jgi:hypothetical protein